MPKASKPSSEPATSGKAGSLRARRRYKSQDPCPSPPAAAADAELFAALADFRRAVSELDRVGSRGSSYLAVLNRITDTPAHTPEGAVAKIEMFIAAYGRPEDGYQNNAVIASALSALTDALRHFACGDATVIALCEDLKNCEAKYQTLWSGAVVSDDQDAALEALAGIYKIQGDRICDRIAATRNIGAAGLRVIGKTLRQIDDDSYWERVRHIFHPGSTRQPAPR